MVYTVWYTPYGIHRLHREHDMTRQGHPPPLKSTRDSPRLSPMGDPPWGIPMGKVALSILGGGVGWGGEKGEAGSREVDKLVVE